MAKKKPLEPVLLTRDEIAHAHDDTIERVDAPEWKSRRGHPGYVYVKNPSDAERAQFERDMVAAAGPDREANLHYLRQQLAVRFVCDDKRETILLGEDLKWLSEKNAAPINRIADVALRLGGFTDEAINYLVAPKHRPA